MRIKIKRPHMEYGEGTEEGHQARAEFILGSRKQCGKVGYSYPGW